MSLCGQGLKAGVWGQISIKKGKGIISPCLFFALGQNVLDFGQPHTIIYRYDEAVERKGGVRWVSQTESTKHSSPQRKRLKTDFCQDRAENKIEAVGEGERPAFSAGL